MSSPLPLQWLWAVTSDCHGNGDLEPNLQGAGQVSWVGSGGGVHILLKPFLPHPFL